MMIQERTDKSVPIRRRWLIKGQVQGVGFRPFVYRRAVANQLSGFVLNNGRGVQIEAQGSPYSIDRFGKDLLSKTPPLAEIHEITESMTNPQPFEKGFVIQSSDASVKAEVAVTVDAATCVDCINDLQDSRDRRFGYPLINCTNCGPRYSIIQHVPYDRPNTTMHRFKMCPCCQREYTRPEDRRFHAQPISCHQCGPQVELVDRGGQKVTGDPLQIAAQLLGQGSVVAIKGLGGFHLAVRADDPQAVGRLRRLKKRDAKPFALMCRNLSRARQTANLSPEAIEWLTSPAAPIVLAAKQPSSRITEGVAPGSDRFGVMLPYTPVQHLIFEELEKINGGCQPPALVMTSANQTDEPLVIANREAIDRLGASRLCDAILWHDRPIERCVDDSVILDTGDRHPLFFRRSRGFVPAPIRMPVTAPSHGICLGGDLKNTVAVVKNNEVILSQHLGDLSHPVAFTYFKQAISDMIDLFEVDPQWIAHDMHPGYFSTAYAQELSNQLDLPLLPIQHHHAHAASLMAETDKTDSVLALVLDGTGYGTDQSIWGGELLMVNQKGFLRLAHLEPLKLLGGDAAAKDIRRTGLSILYQTLGNAVAEHPLARRLIADPREREFLCRMLQNNVNSALSSGAGRLFDGVSALLGLCNHNHYEAQAAVSLEMAARNVPPLKTDEILFHYALGRPQISLAPLYRFLLCEKERGAAPEELAATFHEQFARSWQQIIRDYARTTGCLTVTLTGGVFCNQILSERLTQLIEQDGIKVLRHHQVPCNDGGLALGQAMIAAWPLNANMNN
jgi:hydrogenase maturation protein HypF